ncbi:MAG: hypothetical protein AAGN35_03070 [Bacteroidota bacterium]
MKIWQIITAIALSSVKHTLGGVPLAAGFGFSYWEIALYTAIGGIIGVATFIFFSQLIQRLLGQYLPVKKRKKRIFTRKNRFIVQVKRNFGLIGIAFITPCILSVPVGTMISYGIYRDRRRVFAFLAASVVLWSCLGAALVQPLAQLFA